MGLRDDRTLLWGGSPFDFRRGDIDLVRRWQECVIRLDEMLYEDARKEFSLTSMIGFGVDGSNKEKQQDFEGVRGDFVNNPFVTAVQEHIVNKRALGDELDREVETFSIKLMKPLFQELPFPIDSHIHFLCGGSTAFYSALALPSGY